MAEEPEEDEDSEWEDEEEEEEMFDEDAMRGFRFFWNNLNGEPHDEDDEADEQQVEEWADRAATNQNQAEPNVPTTDFVAQKLREQGVTFEQLVKSICYIEHEEYQDDETAARVSDELFGKIRIIVSNYTPEQAVTPVQQPAPVATPVQQPAPEVDFTAQPKTQVRNVSVPRFMMHV